MTYDKPHLPNSPLGIVMAMAAARDPLAECRVRVSELEALLAEAGELLEHRHHAATDGAVRSFLAKLKARTKDETMTNPETAETLLAECEAAIERWHYSPNSDSFAALVAVLDKLKARRPT